MKILIELSEISLEERIRLAKSSANTELLNALAEDEDYDVRKVVAGSKNATAEILLNLAKDEDCNARRLVAANANATAEILVKLAKDKNSLVREAAETALKRNN